MTYFYVASYNTVKALVYRHFKTTQAHPGLALVSARIRNRLFKYTLLFSLMWGLGETTPVFGWLVPVHVNNVPRSHRHHTYTHFADAILMWMYIFFGNGAKPNIRLVLQTIWYARPLKTV